MLKFDTLQHDKMSYKSISMKLNEYETKDNLITSEWPTLTGSFYDIEETFDFKGQKLQMPGYESVIANLEIGFG